MAHVRIAGRKHGRPGNTASGRARFSGGPDSIPGCAATGAPRRRQPRRGCSRPMCGAQMKDRLQLRRQRSACLDLGTDRWRVRRGVPASMNSKPAARTKARRCHARLPNRFQSKTSAAQAASAARRRAPHLARRAIRRRDTPPASIVMGPTTCRLHPRTALGHHADDDRVLLLIVGEKEGPARQDEAPRPALLQAPSTAIRAGLALVAPVVPATGGVRLAREQQRAAPSDSLRGPEKPAAAGSDPALVRHSPRRVGRCPTAAGGVARLLARQADRASIRHERRETDAR